MAFEPLNRSEFRGSGLGRELWTAARRRAPLAQVTDAYRLVDADGDKLPGLVIERYADFLVVNLYSALDDAATQRVLDAAFELGPLGVYLKHRVRGDLRHVARANTAPSLPARGESAPKELQVREHDLRFSVRLDDGFSTGLFVDQRDNRQWLKLAASGKRVLNLFAYTGSFSIAAGVGGAQHVTTVDLSQAALKRCDANIVLNQLEPKQHRLLRADAVDWLRRAVRRADTYDLIVLDPPSFASVGTDTFSVARQYAELCAQCVRILAPGGRLLAVTNHRGSSVQELLGMLRAAVQTAGRALYGVSLRSPTTDCSLHEVAPDLSTKSALLEIQ